jgi:hypothetical protein
MFDTMHDDHGDDGGTGHGTDTGSAAEMVEWHGE